VSPRALRIFARGHALEAVAAGWLKRAGVVLLTEGPCTGRQFPVSFCGGRLKGHADSIICHWRGEEPCPVPLPCLWECKVLGHKYTMQARREGIGKSHPRYAAQAALYMEGLRLERCLFTVVDADLMELYFELADADPALSARKQEHFLRIEAAFPAGETVPRGETICTAVLCRMCRWAEACWEDKCWQAWPCREATLPWHRTPAPAEGGGAPQVRWKGSATAVLALCPGLPFWPAGGLQADVCLSFGRASSIT